MEKGVVMALFALRLKAQRPLLALACAVVLFQLVLGQTASDVLANRQPPLGIAIQQQGGDTWSEELVAELTCAANLEVIEIDPTLAPRDVFRAHHIQGLVTVPADFGACIEAGRHSPVTLYSAPQVMDSDYVREQIADAVMLLRARHHLEVALVEMGTQPVSRDDIADTDLLDVVYEGPALQGNPNNGTPAFGISALLMLLAYLHTALTVPTHEDRRLLAHGPQAFVRQFCASMLVVWLVWLIVAVLYFVLMTVFSGGSLKTQVAISTLLPACLSFLAIALYASLAAALLAQFFGRHVASWVFLPLFLLNMTIGGGLWGKVALSSLLSPLVPVTAAAATGESVFLGTGMLLFATVVAAVLLVVLLRVRLRSLLGRGTVQSNDD
jgi:hypothetical protein